MTWEERGGFLVCLSFDTSKKKNLLIKSWLVVRFFVVRWVKQEHSRSQIVFTRAFLLHKTRNTSRSATAFSVGLAPFCGAPQQHGCVLVPCISRLQSCVKSCPQTSSLHGSPHIEPIVNRSRAKRCLRTAMYPPSSLLLVPYHALHTVTVVLTEGARQ